MKLVTFTLKDAQGNVLATATQTIDIIAPPPQGPFATAYTDAEMLSLQEGTRDTKTIDLVYPAGESVAARFNVSLPERIALDQDRFLPLF